MPNITTNHAITNTNSYSRIRLIIPSLISNFDLQIQLYFSLYFSGYESPNTQHRVENIWPWHPNTRLLKASCFWSCRLNSSFFAADGPQVCKVRSILSYEDFVFWIWLSWFVLQSKLYYTLWVVIVYAVMWSCEFLKVNKTELVRFEGFYKIYRGNRRLPYGKGRSRYLKRIWGHWHSWQSRNSPASSPTESRVIADCAAS